MKAVSAKGDRFQPATMSPQTWIRRPVPVPQAPVLAVSLLEIEIVFFNALYYVEKSILYVNSFMQRILF